MLTNIVDDFLISSLSSLISINNGEIVELIKVCAGERRKMGRKRERKRDREGEGEKEREREKERREWGEIEGGLR